MGVRSFQGTIAGDGETRQATDRGRRVLGEVTLAVCQAAAGVGGEDHRSAGGHHQRGGHAPQNGPVRLRLRQRSQQHTGAGADRGGDPAPEVPLQERRIVASLVGQEPPREGRGTAAERCKPEHGIEDTGREAGGDARQSRQADGLQQERQEQQGDRQVQEDRVEPPEEQGQRDAGPVRDPHEGQRGQDEDGGHADRERRGEGETTGRWRFGWFHERATASGAPYDSVRDRFAQSSSHTRSDAARRCYPVGSPPPMAKTVLGYGLLGGLLIVALRLVEYRYLVLSHSLEIYGGLVALLFSGLGLWLGLKLTRRRETVVVKEVPVPVTVTVEVPVAAPFVRNTARVEALGITPRELEILELIAEGLSTREIAEKLFVSENTVKTHAGRLFDKLSAKRRTQAVQLAKQAGLIP